MPIEKTHIEGRSNGTRLECTINSNDDSSVSESIRKILMKQKEKKKGRKS